MAEWGQICTIIDFIKAEQEAEAKKIVYSHFVVLEKGENPGFLGSYGYSCLLIDVLVFYQDVFPAFLH